MSELDLSVLARERGWLYRLASTLVQDDEEARDLVQQTVLRALQRPTQGGVTTLAWLDRILRNLWIDSVRRRRAHALEDPAAVRSAKPSVEEAAQRWEASTALREALARLPREQWEVVILRFQEELTNAEIADRLGVAPSTVVTRLVHAYAGLRSQLSGRFGRENWALALVPMAALVTRQKSRVASVSTAAALIGVTALATILGLSVLRATDASNAVLEAARVQESGNLLGVGVSDRTAEAELDVPLASSAARVAPLEQGGTLPDQVLDSEEEPDAGVGSGMLRHLSIDGQRVTGYRASLTTRTMSPSYAEVLDVGEDGFSLEARPGAMVILSGWTEDPASFILYSANSEPNLEFTTGSVELRVHAGSKLIEDTPLDEDGQPTALIVYWTDGLGVEVTLNAFFQDGVAVVEKVPIGDVELKVFRRGVSAVYGSWPNVGTAVVRAGERTRVDL